MLELWAIFALAAAMLCGISGVISKAVLRGVSSSTLIFSSFLVITPVSVFLLIYYAIAIGFDDVNSECLILGLISALFANLGFFLYFDALKRGPIMVIGSITSAYPALIIVVAVLALGEILTLLHGIGVITITAGVVALTYLHGSADERGRCPRSAILLGLLAFLSWGIWGILLKIALEDLDVVLYLGLSALVMPPLTYGYLRASGSEMKFRIPKLSVPLMLAIVSVEVEQLGFYNETFAVSSGPAALVFPVIASYPAITILLAFMFLRERISRKEFLLIAIIVTGIVLVSTI